MVNWDSLPDNFHQMSPVNTFNDNVFTNSFAELPITSRNFGTEYGKILLPSNIYIAQSIECNLWWSSIANYIDGDKSVLFKVNGFIGKTMDRCYRVDTSVIASELITIISYDQHGFLIDSKDVTIHVVNKNAGTGTKNILMIGDSRTWQSISDIQGSDTYTGGGDNKTITTRVKNLCGYTEGAHFDFIGTQISQLDANVKNEGYSGWSWQGIVSNSSIFWNPNTNALDFKYYMNNVLGLTNQKPNYATIMLGINDLLLGYWDKKDKDIYTTIIKRIDDILGYSRTLINQFVSDFPDCKLLIVIESTTCEHQSAFGEWNQMVGYPNTSGYDCERALKEFRKRIIEDYDNGKYNSNVILSSAGVWADRTYGFPYVKEKVSKQSSVATELLFKNSIHPHDDGYNQIGDGIFSTIKYLESI